jgi:hypothetical protein
VKNPAYAQARHELFEKRRKSEPGGHGGENRKCSSAEGLHAHVDVAWKRAPQGKVLLAAFLGSRW